MGIGMWVGWNFPVEVSDRNGKIQTSVDKANIRQSVEIILLTEPGERIAHPTFGTKLHQFLFESMNSQTEELIRREVRQALQTWESRIENIAVEINRERYAEGILQVNVSYRIVNSGEKDAVEVSLSNGDMRVKG